MLRGWQLMPVRYSTDHEFDKLLQVVTVGTEAVAVCLSTCHQARLGPGRAATAGTAKTSLELQADEVTFAHPNWARGITLLTERACEVLGCGCVDICWLSDSLLRHSSAGPCLSNDNRSLG